MSESRKFSTDASEQPQTSEVVLSLKTVHKMVPLVQSIAADIITHSQTIDRLLPEEERLDRQRHSLDWPGRQKRYQIKEELASADGARQANIAELHELGLALLDASTGLIGFPTLVNNRRAYFSWRSGEESISNWQFADEALQRPIPAAWYKELAPAKA